MCGSRITKGQKCGPKINFPKTLDKIKDSCYSIYIEKKVQDFKKSNR